MTRNECIDALIIKHFYDYDTIFAEDSAFGPRLYLWDKYAVRTEYGASNCRLIGATWARLRVDGEVSEYFVRLCPRWSLRHEEIAILQEHIKARRLHVAYIEQILADLAITDPSASGLWAFLTCSPEQRCLALLRVLGVDLSGLPAAQE